jgi:hypothetical protein
MQHIVPYGLYPELKRSGQIFVRPAMQHDRAGRLCTLCKRRREARFADTRLAGHEYNATFTTARTPPRRL